MSERLGAPTTLSQEHAREHGPGDRRRANRLCAGLGLALALWALLAWRFNFLVDDAFISFRYARHLAEGLGLRFNPGQGPPVEGYSNLAWVLCMAVFERVGLVTPVAARVLSLAAAAALLGLLARALARSGPLPRAPGSAIVALVFLAGLPPFAVWSTGGLETMLFALAVFLTWERLAGPLPRPLQAGLAAAAAVLLRADGAAIVLLPLGAVAAAGLLRGQGRRTRAALLGALLPLAAALSLLVWRKLLYGDWLPHTAHNKLELSAGVVLRGARYVAALGLAVPSLLVALGLGARALLREARDTGVSGARASAALECALVLLGAAAYGCLTGGDWMPWGRYLVFALPFLAVLVALGLEALRAPARAAWATALVGLSLAAALDVHLTPRALRERLDFRFGMADYLTELDLWRELAAGYPEWIRAARALARHVEPGQSMPCGAVGIPGYYTDLVLYDTWGLTGLDAEASDAPRQLGTPGHDRFVGPEAFLPRHPTYFGYVFCPAGAPASRGLGEGWEYKPLGRLIEVERHPLADGSGDELRLLRLTGWDLVPEALVPLLEALEAGEGPDALNASLPADGPAADELRDLLADLPLASFPGGLAARRLARPAPGRESFLVDVWRLDAGAELPAAPDRIDLVLEGAAPGWRSGASGSRGPARIVSFVPSVSHRTAPPR